MLAKKLVWTTVALMTWSEAQALTCEQVLTSEYARLKSSIKETLPAPDRKAGLRQDTGKDLIPGQITFPNRTPADPVPFIDAKTGRAFVYGTQVDGKGFAYLVWKNEDDMLRGVEPKRVERDVFLPNGQLLRGQEAIWDTIRVSYDTLKRVWSEAELERMYLERGIDLGTDLYYGGIALQENGDLGGTGKTGWTVDNWRRRLHVMAEIDGKLTVLKEPLANKVPKGMTEKSYPSLAGLDFLPGDYMGHGYGPNFKLIKTNGRLELDLFNEEVTRRVLVDGKPVEVTEGVRRTMVSPFEASSNVQVVVSVDDENGFPHADSSRGPQMNNLFLAEGFRPTSIEPEGVRITKRAVKRGGKTVLVDDPSLAKVEYFFLTGSPSNFAGDGYDVIMAVSTSPRGPFKIIKASNEQNWKKYLTTIKDKYKLSWAGRASFFRDKLKGWWLFFHGVDKDIRPDGSYGGRIPSDTPAYHRNTYHAPIEFYINERGEPDMLVHD